MPASQTVEYQGFRVSARPGFWLRRWTHFPLYFQATQPSFEIAVLKVAEGESPPTRFTFHVTFANNTHTTDQLDVSSLNVGDRDTLTISNILLAPTGDASIRLHMGRMSGFHTLYAFYVSPEATLVFLLLNAVLAVAFTAVVGLVLR